MENSRGKQNGMIWGLWLGLSVMGGVSVYYYPLFVLTMLVVPAVWAAMAFRTRPVMLLVAAAGFASNFQKKKSNQYILLCVSVLALIVYCYMGYMRQSAEAIFAVFPLLAVLITPILGNYLDHKGKGASMLVLGSILLIACHLTFAFVLPAFKGNDLGGVIVAYVTILVLGASFSLVPAALWPSVPKLVDAKVIGSAYALIFWIQNIGLWPRTSACGCSRS